MYRFAGALRRSAEEDSVTEATPAQQVEMIPIDRVVNRQLQARNRAIFNEFVE